MYFEITLKVPIRMHLTYEPMNRSIGSSINGFKVVGCRDESRNVVGCWGFPYLKTEKLASLHFMFFDRYEIHIQYLVDFHLTNLHHFPDPHLHSF